MLPVGGGVSLFVVCCALFVVCCLLFGVDVVTLCVLCCCLMSIVEC